MAVEKPKGSENRDLRVYFLDFCVYCIQKNIGGKIYR